jgi:hypothetical protein
VVPYTKIYAEHGTMSDSFAPAGNFARGTLRFVWDNSFSKLTGKKVKFKLTYSH